MHKRATTARSLLDASRILTWLARLGQSEAPPLGRRFPGCVGAMWLTRAREPTSTKTIHNLALDASALCIDYVFTTNYASLA
jgi:hypothetical protein